MKVTGFSLTQDIEVEQTFNMWTDIPIFIGEPKKCDYVVVRRTSVSPKRESLIDLVTRSASKAILYNSASSTTPVYPCRWKSLRKQAEGTFGNFSKKENVLVRLPLYTRGRPRRLTKKKLCVSRAFWKLGGSSNIMTSQRIQTELNNDNLRLPETSGQDRVATSVECMVRNGRQLNRYFWGGFFITIVEPTGDLHQNRPLRRCAWALRNQ